MKLATLYDTVGKVEEVASGADPANARRRIELANAMVRDLLDEYKRLEAYEKQYLPDFEHEAEDAYALEDLRSIAQMFEAWLADAQPVYDSVRQNGCTRGRSRAIASGAGSRFHVAATPASPRPIDTGVVFRALPLALHS